MGLLTGDAPARSGATIGFVDTEFVRFVTNRNMPLFLDCRKEEANSLVVEGTTNASIRVVVGRITTQRRIRIQTNSRMLAG